MHILFLGPECPRLQRHLTHMGHMIHQTETPLSLACLRAHFDFGLSYRYRHIIRQDVINYFSGRLINMHISLLPWNRGADPNFWSFLEDTPKGVTIHRIDAGMDTGDILLQEELYFVDDAAETLRTTYTTLSEHLEQLFLDNAEALLSGTIPARPQPKGGSSHRYRDKIPYLHLIESAGWDTPVRELKKRIAE